MDIIPVCCRISRLPFWSKYFVGTPCALRVGCGLWIFGPPYYFLFLLFWAGGSWFHGCILQEWTIGVVWVFFHMETHKNKYKLMLPFWSDVLHGANDIFRHEYVSRCLAWHRVSRGDPADAMSVWTYGWMFVEVPQLTSRRSRCPSRRRISLNSWLFCAWKSKK